MKITIDSEKLEDFFKAQKEYSKKEFDFYAYIAEVVAQSTEGH